MRQLSARGAEQAPVALTRERLAALADRIAAALAAWHRAQPDMLGPTRLALLAQLRGVAPEAALDAALAELASTGRAAREGGMWRLPEHRPRLTDADEKLWQRVRPLLAAAELRPPRMGEIAASLALEAEAVERLLYRAERLGVSPRSPTTVFFCPKPWHASQRLQASWPTRRRQGPSPQRRSRIDRASAAI